MNRFNEWVQSRAARLEQYGPSEIAAELLRQEIRELEKESLDPHQKHKIFTNAGRIMLLKEQLDEEKKFAELQAQSRHVAKACFLLGTHMMETKEFPPGANEVLDKYLALLDTLAEHERDFAQRQRSQIARSWLNSSWPYRLQLLRWYWRTSSNRFLRGTIPSKLSRGAIKMLKGLH